MTRKQLARALTRREALGTLGAVGLAAIPGCSASPTSSTTATGGSLASSSPIGSSCTVTPSETKGPYPDKIGMLGNLAFFRRDIAEGRPGLALMLTLTIVNVAKACTAVASANVEVWQCDASGNYSEYAQPGFDGTGKTFLRGLQTTDANGQVTFQTIYPGWYVGRAPHIHVDVFINGTLTKSTQIAFPESTTAAVYATDVYASHGQNPTKNAADSVFSDGTQLETATLVGSATSGYNASLTIGISL